MNDGGKGGRVNNAHIFPMPSIDDMMRVALSSGDLIIADTTITPIEIAGEHR